MKINDTVLGPGDTEGCKTIFLTLRSSVLKETHTHRHTHTHTQVIPMYESYSWCDKELQVEEEEGQTNDLQKSDS